MKMCEIISRINKSGEYQNYVLIKTSRNNLKGIPIYEPHIICFVEEINAFIAEGHEEVLIISRDGKLIKRIYTR